MRQIHPPGKCRGYLYWGRLNLSQGRRRIPIRVSGIDTAFSHVMRREMRIGYDNSSFLGCQDLFDRREEYVSVESERDAMILDLDSCNHEYDIICEN